WLPALIWALIVSYFSLTPLNSVPHPDFPGSDKIYHLGSYAILQLLLFFPVRKNRTANLFTILFFLNILLGITMEIIQGTSVEGRTAEMGDILFNTFGAMIIYFFFLGKWGKSK